ncbi:MAG: hypothetical protein RI996_342 [Candidatus Parcubacteria bacterium]|jgi:hypothetical protein
MDRHTRDGKEAETKTRLQSIEERIYSVHNGVEWKDRRSTIHENSTNENPNWKAIEEVSKRTTTEKIPSTFFTQLSRRLFYFAICFFVIVLGFSVYHFVFNANGVSANKIGMAIEAPGYIDGGEVFSLIVFIANQNNSALENVDLIVEYPKGESISSQEDTVVTRIPIGTIQSKETAKGVADIVLYGREGNNRSINAYIEYYAPGSSVVLKKKMSHTLTIKSAPVVITTESLKEVTANTEVSFTTRIKAERGKTLENFLVQIEYPNGFQYTGANIEPSFGNNVWKFDTIQKGETRDIVVRGLLRGEDGDEKVFRVAGGVSRIAGDSEIAIVFADTKSGLVLKKPFVELTGVFEEAAQLENGDFALKAGGNQYVTLTYKSNIAETVYNMVITAVLSGEIINKRKIVVENGYFDSAKNTIIWDSVSKPALKQLLPGETKTVRFSFESFPLSAKQNGYFSSPEIKAKIALSGKRFNNSQVPEISVLGRELTGRIITETGLQSKVLSEGGPLVYTGTKPLQADTETSYTVELKVNNRSNPLANAQVQMILPRNVRYIAQSDEGIEQVTYSESTRLLTWNIQTVAPDVGYGRASRVLYLSLGVTPSSNQFGQKVQLSEQNIIFSAEDTHTETKIVRTYEPLKTPEIVQ